ncbi:MAG: hypothetical protein JWQ07_4581 [Ramlibacter sp.]|nr:hypothetical protein [Ramlibacter sp.]
MNTGSSHYQVSLAHKGLFDIADAAGVNLRCEEGSVWITLDNDPRDIVLEAGEVFTATEHRHALVYALAPATLTLQAPSLPRAQPTRVSFGLRPALA